MNSGIYKFTNSVNGKVYVGSSVNLKQRLAVHKSTLRSNTHDSSYLQRAYNKYGENNFTFEIIEYCNESIIVEREQHWIDETKCYERSMGYNRRRNAENNLGMEYAEKVNMRFKGSSLNKEQVIDIKLMLRDTQITQVQISEIFNVDDSCINNIASDITFAHTIITDEDKLDYNKYEGVSFERKMANSKLTQNEVRDIKLFLRDYDDIAPKTIGEIFNVTQATIMSIKNNKKHKRVVITDEDQLDIEKYNVSEIKRKKRLLSKEEVREIKLLLRDTDLMQKDIAVLFNIAKNRVSDISTGKVFADVILD